MSITRETLSSAFPEDKAKIDQMSDEELSNINKFLSGDTDEFSGGGGSTILILADTSSHTLHTINEFNDGSGGSLSSDARGFRSSSIPKFAPGVSYSVTLSGKTITLYASGGTYTYISIRGTVASSSASGTFS